MTSIIKIKPRTAWFLGFFAVFSALAAFVFWGTWSLDVTPVMPDDGYVHSMAYADYWDGFLRGFISSGRVHPIGMLWSGLVFSPYFCQELKYVVALLASALGMSFFLRGRGLSNLASYGAGLLLAFCGYWSTLFSAGHAGWFMVIAYVTFDFGLSDRAVRGNRLHNWLLLGLCVGWSWLCQPDFCFIMTSLAVLYFGWCCIRERKFPWQGMMIAAVLCAAIAIPGFKGAIADKASRDAQIAKGDTVANVQGVDEKEKRWIFVTNWSLPPAETAEFFIPRLNGDTSCPLTLSIGMRNGTGVKPYTGALGRPIDAKEGNYRQHSLYVGWVTCLLALVGVILGVRRAKSAPPDLYFFIGAAILFWLLSLGRNFEPLYRLIFALPVGDSIRAPVKWHHATEFCLVVLAGFGIGYLESALGKLKNARWLLIALTAFVALGAFDLARNAKLYCAPVDLRQVRKTNSTMQMNVLRRQDFANPQVADMVKRGRIVSLANYLGNPNLYLVEMLTPRQTPAKREPLPPVTAVTWLGFLSVVAALGAIITSIVIRRRRCG